MTMASRDIANMHLFLDLKKKFPDLPDETLRSYISLFAEDQEKCISLLQKESENHYHPSQPFPDFRLPESKVNSMKNDYVKHFVGNPSEGSFPSVNLQDLDISTYNKKIPTASGRSSSHAGVVHLPGKSLSLNIFAKPESRSAPVITSSEKPFNDLYKKTPISSHTTLHQIPSNQIMFHTTKNHIMEAPAFHESTAYLPVCGEPEESRKNAVKISLTPSFPFQQQPSFNSSVCATASHSSGLGRHTTSLIFQLQPQSSDQLPLEISTIPTNIGHQCNPRDFGSHVQISVGAQGATFTAGRLQRPSYSQTQNTPHLPVTEECPEEYMPSSQAPNSNLLFPNQRIQLQGFDQSQDIYASEDHPNVQIGSIHHYQLSPDYILAVKNLQLAQLDLILSELEKEKSICSQLRTEVHRMEQEVTQRNATTTSFPYTEELQKLREEVRNLSVEISCLSMEVDSEEGQIPLGVTDEGFYNNIFTGQNLLSPTQDNLDAPQPNAENVEDKVNDKSSLEEEENDEKNRWRCSECTFVNHPALEKCEICELPKKGLKMCIT